VGSNRQACVLGGCLLGVGEVARHGPVRVAGEAEVSELHIDGFVVVGALAKQRGVDVPAFESHGHLGELVVVPVLPEADGTASFRSRGSNFVVPDDEICRSRSVMGEEGRQNC